MFTGLIQAIGVVQQISETAEGRLLRIHCPSIIQDIDIDDSIATNGVCLTATTIEPNAFIAQAIHTTLEKTSIGSLQQGERVNLELALRANDRLGGHMCKAMLMPLARYWPLKCAAITGKCTFHFQKTYENTWF